LKYLVVTINVRALAVTALVLGVAFAVQSYRTAYWHWTPVLDSLHVYPDGIVAHSSAPLYGASREGILRIELWSADNPVALAELRDRDRLFSAKTAKLLARTKDYVSNQSWFHIPITGRLRRDDSVVLAVVLRDGYVSQTVDVSGLLGQGGSKYMLDTDSGKPWLAFSLLFLAIALLLDRLSASSGRRRKGCSTKASATLITA
jgi:hypothetical protein